MINYIVNFCRVDHLHVVIISMFLLTEQSLCAPERHWTVRLQVGSSFKDGI